MKARKPLGRTSGFTLLEVMIAMAILAMVGVAFLGAQASSVHLVDESSQISIATLLAREKMAELENLGFPDLGKTSGEGDQVFPQYRWEKIISSTDIPELRKALVRILWVEGTNQRTLELVAYFARK